MSDICVSRVTVVIAAVLVLAGVGAAVRPLTAQSLAELAKKEEERRQTIPAPAKVSTNKDLNPAPAGSTPSADASAKPADAAKAAATDRDPKAKDAKAKDDKDKEPAKDQAYWTGRLKQLQDQLLRDQNYADAMQTRVNSLTTDFVNRDDPAQRAVIERDRQKSLAELARLTKGVQDTKKAIADLLEEARRAGVPPGWLR